MPDVLTALTELAVSIFRNRVQARDLISSRFSTLLGLDPVLQEAHRDLLQVAVQNPALDDVVRLAMARPDLSPLAAGEGELGPMLMYPGGGFRLSFTAIFTSLLTSAMLQMYFLRLPQDEGTYVRVVLEGFDEFRRAVAGEPIRAHALSGVARVTLREGTQISTPWGIIRPAPPATPQHFIWPSAQPRTTCILDAPRLLPVRFDRDPNPQTIDPVDLATAHSAVLLQLSCALASEGTAKPAVPLLTWSTLLLPFQVGFGYSAQILPPAFGTEADLTDRVREVEEWARVVDRAHAPAVDVAAGRLVSAVANRMDMSDSLIDAVMAWENLVGTPDTEVSFRVTAALAKLLESDLTKRRALRKELADIYRIRSRVVHGGTVNPSEVTAACARAIEVAVGALRASYARGRDWLALTSGERSDAILLEWE